MEGKKTKGRQKISMKRIENEEDRLITFSKRRSGVYKKASELAILCGAEIAVLVFSPAGKPFSFGHPSMEAVVSRFLGHDQRGNDNTYPLVEAHRKVRINELNHQHNEMINHLEVEKERAKVLKQIARSGGKVSDQQGWWDAPVDELNLEELKKMGAMLEDLHATLCAKIKEKSNAVVTAAVVSPPLFPARNFMAAPHVTDAEAFASNESNGHASSSFPHGLGYGCEGSF